jgi:hypothetical protein
MEPKGSLPCSQDHSAGPYLETDPVHTTPPFALRSISILYRVDPLLGYDFETNNEHNIRC